MSGHCLFQICGPLEIWGKFMLYTELGHFCGDATGSGSGQVCGLGGARSQGITRVE